MKNVLVFGAGRIAGPCVRHLLKEPDFQVTVIDQDLKKAQKVIGGHPRGAAKTIALPDSGPLIKNSDLVVSLLPRSLDLYIIKKCLENKTSIVFPNFISTEIQELDRQAKDSGVTALGEVGLDPGIDHMSAVKIIDQVKEKGGQVVGFSSWCGGLPSPEAALEPLRYKFSWSPEGAIEASKCPAKYLDQGRVVSISGDDLMKHYTFKFVPGCGWFEEYANSDATFYIAVYDIPEVTTIYRGTFRYPGWCEIIAGLNQMGLFETGEEDLSGLTYLDFTGRLIGAPGKSDPAAALAEYLGVREHSLVVKNIQWLGLLDENPLPFKRASARDVLSDLLLKKLVFGPGERDLVVMLHEFDVCYPGGNDERITSTLIEYGEPGGDSAMAKTTGLPLAIAAKLVLKGKFTAAGVQLPVHRELYQPLLEELKTLGIAMKDDYSRLK